MVTSLHSPRCPSGSTFLALSLGVWLSGQLTGAPLGAQVFAGVPYIVRDINTEHHRSPSRLFTIGGFVEVDGRLFFKMDDGIHGSELWVVEPVGEARLVEDTVPGVFGTSLGDLRGAAVNGRLVFTNSTPRSGSGLWVSDGTSAGTGPLADVSPGHFFAAAGPVVFFTGHDPARGGELWRSDGTTEGTWLVTDLRPGPESSNAEPFAGRDGTVWLLVDGAGNGRELWRSDGTPEGTSLVAAPPGSAFLMQLPALSCWSNPFAVMPDGDLLFGDFSQEAGGLWRSDGTPGGTSRLVELEAAAEVTAAGDRFVFRGIDATNYERALWSTDGTAAGTGRIADVDPWRITVAGARAFLVADDGVHGFEPWSTDGTVEGTQLVVDMVPGPAGGMGDDLIDFFLGPTTIFDPFEELFLFTATDGLVGFEPWATDGQAAGTFLLADLNPGAPSSQSTRASVLGSFLAGCPGVTPAALYFFAYDETRGFALWRTAGTSESTELVQDMTEQTSAFHFSNGFFTGTSKAEGSRLLFFATEDDPWTTNPWISDGTPEGTLRLAEAQPRGEVAAAAETLFFVATTPDAGPGLWATDGTPEGTRVLFAELPDGNSGLRPSPLAALPDQLLFFAEDGEGRHLFGTDGTPEGTSAIADLTPSSCAAVWSELVRPSAIFAGVAHFCADGQLWRSDGTAAGTWPLTGGGRPIAFETTSTAFFFGGEDPTHGRELWTSDGTPAGTRLVRDVRPGPESGFPDAATPHFVQPTHVGERIFFVADDGTHGAELWRSDGTEEGTALVRDVAPGAASSRPESLTAVGGLVYFVAFDPEHGRELWVTNGTETGTQLVADVAPGPPSSLPTDLLATGSSLLFAAYGPYVGRELWSVQSGGTPEPYDLAPGPRSSSPTQLRLTDRHLFFVANDNTHGFELWALARHLESPLFGDGFESGDLSRWSASAE